LIGCDSVDNSAGRSAICTKLQTEPPREQPKNEGAGQGNEKNHVYFERGFPGGECKKLRFLESIQKIARTP